MSAIFQVYGLTAADGALSWRALNALTADALPDGAARGRIQIMPIGAWKGHPSGPLEVDHVYLQSIVTQFEAQANPMPVDYDHSAPERGDTRAAGWIRALEIVGDWLWGDVEWTPAAAEAIRAKEYQFSSPWWADKPKDRVSGKATGPRMFNVALTNLPFFDGQQALTCSTVAARVAAETPAEAQTEPAPESTDSVTAAVPAPISEEEKPMPDEILQAIAKSCGLTPEAVLAALPGIADQIGAMLRDAPAPKEGEEVPAPQPVTASVVIPPAAPAPLSADAAARIASEAKLTGLIASVAELTKKADARDKADAEAKTAAETKLATERTERIASMVRDGRIAVNEQDDAAKLLAHDAAMFDVAYKDRKPTVPLGITQAGPEAKSKPGDDVSFTASEQHTLRSLQGAGYAPAKARELVIATRAP